MDVDKAWGDNEMVGIDGSDGRPRQLAVYRHNLVAANADVANEPRVPGAVDDFALANDQIVWTVILSQRQETLMIQSKPKC